MTELFRNVLNVAFAAGWLVPVVMLLRLLLKKAPKSTLCLLWALVGLRLLLPFSIPSPTSLIPSADLLPSDIEYVALPTLESGIPALNEVINPILSERFAATPTASVNPIQITLFFYALLWLSGIVAMFLYALISTLRVRHRVKASLCLKDNVYVCDAIDTPFILGLFRPRIYLPSELGKEENTALREQVLAHEHAHLKRLDHLWKPLGFLLLTVYWFHPLLWIAYLLLCRDIEAACDEKVIAHMDEEARKAYSAALLACSTGKKITLSVCPLAFGETGVKTRIKSVLNYKKPSFWLILLAAAATVVFAVCFLTDPMPPHHEDIVSVGGERSVSIVGSSSELGGVTLSLEAIDLSSETPSFTIRWYNKRQTPLAFGAMFSLSRLVDGEWKDCAVREDIYFTMIAYLLNAGGSREQTYSLIGYDLTETGLYRFEADCYDPAAEKRSDYTVSLEFELEKDADSDPVASADTTSFYVYTESPDWMNPRLTLNEENKSFSFVFSGLSSVIPSGFYTEEGGILSCRDSITGNTYVFRQNGDAFVFDASSSAKIPSYNYYADSSESLCPVPDGALFRALLSVEDVPYVASAAIDSTAFDLDGDGEAEACTLLPGSTSGRLTVTLAVSGKDGASYRCTVEPPYPDLSFDTSGSGLSILCKSEDDGSTVRLSVSLKDGVLTVQHPLP